MRKLSPSLLYATIAPMLFILLMPNAWAENRVVNLSVGYKAVNFAGESVQAIAINGQIPAPTLHFKEGDHVTINVTNHLKEGTTIHWHGLLLPWQMDGVEGVTQHAIAPGGTFSYQFILKQSGTYWYHSHAGFQEQQGMYGAFIIDPEKPPAYQYNKDYVIVLSDWSNTSPNTIFANLKKQGDYYSSKFPLQPSLMRFMQTYRKADSVDRAQLVDDYKMMQQMRMSIYDISDVAYDTFLLNGQTPTHPWTAPVKVGDTVRLRFIGANAGVISHIKIPGTTMRMVHVQGHDVRPYTITDFSIAPGETYDVLVHIKENKPYIIYAESADKIGLAYGALITAPQQNVDYTSVVPFPTPQSTTQEMMNYMMQSGGQKMDMHDMKMSSMQHNMDSMPAMDHAMAMDDMPATIISTSLGTKYQNMMSLAKTNDPDKPVTVINMALYGYMEHFVWFIDGVPEYGAKPIILEPGKRYRIIFANESMMHHPMHIHGHFFILRNGHGAYDPFLHTIDVPPGATVVADFDADAGGGQWFFHCHFLYHMMAGMSRVFQYSNLPQEVASHVVSHDAADLVKHPMGHAMGLFRSSMLEASVDPIHNIQLFSFKTLFGTDYDKLELNAEATEINKGKIDDANLDVFYWHLLSEFWAIKGGANYVYRPAQRAYLQPGMGIEGLMPYFIDTDIRSYYHNGSAKLDLQLSRDTQISNRFFIRTGIATMLATKTVAADSVGSGLNQIRYMLRPYYRLMPQLSVFLEYEHEDDYGDYAQELREEGEPSSQNIYSLGLSFLF